MLSFRRLLVIAAIASLSHVGFSQTTHTVEVHDNFFSPSTVIIAPGDTVQWVWKGPSGFHTVTNGVSSQCANAGLLFDASVNSGSPTFSFVFNNAGKYDYFCRPHELLGMKGVVQVQGLTLNGIIAGGNNINFTVSSLGPGDEGGKALVLLSATGASPGIPLGCTGTIDIAQDAVTSLGLSLSFLLTTGTITGGTASTPTLPVPANIPSGVRLFYAAVVVNGANFGAILPTETTSTQ